MGRKVLGQETLQTKGTAKQKCEQLACVERGENFSVTGALGGGEEEEKDEIGM